MSRKMLLKLKDELEVFDLKIQEIDLKMQQQALNLKI